MDRTRPSLHIMPPTGWLNDPNGLCRIDGVYHVFYQHNPETPTHHSIHWGHAKSTDLLTWTTEPIALAPQPGYLDAAGCWSGCIVDDAGVPTAIYTAIADTDETAQVALARSDRSLRTWVKDPTPKVGPPDRAIHTDVRDPYVFTFGGHRYAVQGAGHRTGEPQLLLYQCDDLNDWTPLEPLLTAADPVLAAACPANVWECPNIFPLADRWVIILSLWRYVNNTHQLSGVRFLVGDLSETEGGLKFDLSVSPGIEANGESLPIFGQVDTGPAFYAPQVLVESDRVLLWGWTWEGSQRSAAEIDAAGWAGALTFPRELRLGPDGLTSMPAAELVRLRAATLDLAVATVRSNGRVAHLGSSSKVATLPAAPPDSVDLDAVIEETAFEIESEGPLELALFDPATGNREVVVSSSGPVRVFVDGSIVETFGTGPTVTSRHYPTQTSRWLVRAAAGVRGWRLAQPPADTDSAAGRQLIASSD